MKKLSTTAETALALAACIGCLIDAPAFAGGLTVVSGGGTGTFAADLDSDGEIDGSHFGFEIGRAHV